MLPLAPASIAQSASLQLEEIVVTARLREESASSIGQSISAYSGDKIAERGIADIADLVRATPGLDLIDRGPGRSLPSIRGLSLTTGVQDVLQQNTLITQFVDGIAMTSPTQNQSDLPLYDLERVEVLKGPQPTYFGAGSVGGTVRYHLKDPSLEQLEGRLRAEMSQTDSSDDLNYITDGSVGIPLIEGELGIRLTAFHKDDAGFIDNIDNGIDDINSSDMSGGTAVLLYEPNDALRVRLSGVHQRGTIQGTRIVNGDPADLTQGGGPIPFFPGADVVDDEMSMFSGTVSYTFDSFALESVTGYFGRKFDQTFTDRDQTFRVFPFLYPFDAVANPAMAINNAEDENYSQEFRIITNFDSPLNFLGGIYYENTRNRVIQDQRSTGFLSLAPGFDDVYFQADVEIDGEQLSVYGELQLSLMEDRLRLKGGARHFDQSYVTPFSGGIKFPVAPGFFPFLAVEALAGAEQFKNDIKEVLLRASLEFNLNEDSLLYASFSEGARNGLINSPAVIALFGLDQSRFATYGPDFVDAYEVGFKSSFLDGRLQLNAAAFLNEWEDIQNTLQLGFTAVTDNLGKAESKGYELDANYLLNDNFSLFLAFNRTDAAFTGDTLIAPAPDGTCATVLGESCRIPNVPDKTFNAGVEFRQLDILGSADFVANATYQYVGDAVFGSNVQVPIDDYEIVNLRAGIELENWSVMFYANNLFNELTEVFVNPLLSDSYVNRPRTVGAVLRYNFR